MQRESTWRARMRRGCSASGAWRASVQTRAKPSRRALPSLLLSPPSSPPLPPALPSLLLCPPSSHPAPHTTPPNALSALSALSAAQALETVSVQSDDPDEAARTSADLTAFLCAPCNTRCADCSARIKRPADAWVSTSLGVVVCVNCAAAHRSLGTSVSRIKSPVYDQARAATAPRHPRPQHAH